MKKLLALSALMFVGYTVNAQANALEAKAAYLLAEESYGKGEMHAALDYINEASSKLGTANAKICYLKIMILKEVSFKDTNALAKMDSAILAFEKAPDIADFNEEKILEIVKIKIERKRNAVVENEKKKYSAEMLEENMTALQNKIGWRIGMPVDSVVASHKDVFDAFFKKSNRKKNKIEPVDALSLNADTKGVSYIEFRNGLLSECVYYFHNLFETPAYEKSRQVLKQILDDLTNQFGYLPEPKTSSSGPGLPRSTISRYTWESKRVILVLEIQETTSKDNGWAVYKMRLSSKF
jgi:hypothetical protein